MFQRKQRRFRRHSNGRNQISHGKINSQNRMRPKGFSNSPIRSNFRTSLSAEKLFEKYTSLAKEAMSSGDKTLSENYLQHADHFMRVIEDKNRSRNQNKVDLVVKQVEQKNNVQSDSISIEANNELTKKD